MEVFIFGLTLGVKSARLAFSKGTKSPTKRTFVFEDEIDLPKVSRKTSSARDTISYEVVVLEMLVGVLLSPERRYINKFATTITSKVNCIWFC